MVIHKYQLLAKRMSVEMPKGGKVISAKAQKGIVCLWVLCEPKHPKVETRNFVCFNTGDFVPSNTSESYQFIDTVLLDNEATVVHVFEVQ